MPERQLGFQKMPRAGSHLCEVCLSPGRQAALPCGATHELEKLLHDPPAVLLSK